jgi:tryptophan synthase alpha subunit
MEAAMNEEQFNLDLRKFLKRFGISAQRAIEEAVRKGLADGSLIGTEIIKARARLEIEGREVDLLIEEEIHLA